MRLFRSVFFATFLLGVSQISLAQMATTSLRGTITDPSGAVISDGQVTITEPSSGFSQQKKATAQGEYNFQQIPPGKYTVQVDAAGFSQQAAHVELLVNQPSTLNFKLNIGGSNTVVQVSADAASLNTVDATLGTPFNQLQVQALPFAANNILSLLSLQAGVMFLGNQSSATMDADSRSGAVNGARSDQGNVTLDGLDDNTQSQGYAFTGVLRSTRDSVEEFRVVTTNSNADSGRSSGAQVSLVTRSGTNRIHGGAYEYYRPTNTVANNWFNKQAEAQSGSRNTPGKYLRNTFGASIGGPIKKDKLFYFLSYEGDKLAQDVQVTSTVPNASLRAGYVSYTDSSNKTQQLTPAMIAAMDPGCSSLGTCPAGPGVSQAALQYYAKLPLPNGVAVADPLNFGSYTFPSPSPQSLITNIVKVDYALNDKQRFFVRANLQSDNYVGPVNYPNNPATVTSYDNSRGIAAGHIWTISESLINNLRYGFVRQGFANRGANHSDYVTFGGIGTGGASGIAALNPNTTSLIVNVPVHNVIDDITWTKKAHTLQGGFNYRLVYNNRSSDATAYNTASVTYTNLGAGSISGTGKSLDPSAFPQLDILPVNSSASTAYDTAIADATGLISYAAEYLNYKVSGNNLSPLSPGFLTRHFKSNELEYYVQDSWKATRDLTLTFGFRHSILQAPYETSGQQVAPTINLHDWFLNRGAAASQGTVNQPIISFARSGKANGAPGLWAKDKFDFAPRVAFAYSPSTADGWLGKLLGGEGATSIRGGWGMYYDHFGEGIVDTFDSNGAYGLSTLLKNPINLTVDEAPRFSSLTTIPTQIIPTPIAPSSFPVTPGNTSALAWGLDSKLKTPYAEVMDFSIERKLKSGFTFQAAYVGRLGRRLLQNLDVAEPTNLVDPKSGTSYFDAARLLSEQALAGVATSAVQPIAYFENLFPLVAANGRSATQNIYNDLWSYSVGNETFPLYSLDNGSYTGPSDPVTNVPPPAGPLNRYFNSQYASLYAWSSVGSSSYHSLQLSMHHPMANGLQFDMNYVYAKSLDMGSDAERTDYNKGQNFSSIVNSWNIAGNYGPSDFDTRHAITANWLFALPVGRGARFVSGSNKLVDTLIGGWNLSGLTHWTSGLPFSPTDGKGWSTNWATQSWDVLIGPISSGGHQKSPSGQPNAFKSQATARANIRPPFAGETGQRNIFRGDGYFTVDSGLAKSITIVEGQALRLSAEVFNIANSVRFDVNTIQHNPFGGASTFGNYQALLNEPRSMQFSLRYSF